MTRTIALIPLLLAACAADRPETADASACDLEIAFGSYAAGIDRGAYEGTLRILEDRTVHSLDRRGWGREGEVTLCARTRTASDAERLFKRISAILPAKPVGPIRLSTASGLRVDAPPAR